MILSSDFDIGFEIEGIALESNYNKIKEIISNYGLSFLTGDTSIQITPEIEELAEFEYEDEVYTENIVPFEINTIPQEVTPTTILRTINLFIDLYREKIITNNTCALHAHVKLKKDSLHSHSAYHHSAMCVAYLIETKQYQNFQSFEGERMEHTFWSSVDNMMKEYKRTKENVENMISVNHDRRRGLFHSHPMGTLEWRGPRGLFDHNPLAFCNNSLKSFEERIVRYTKFLFSLIPILRNAHNGKGIAQSDSLYWTLYSTRFA
tara:strand:+ start:963 stop:1751 length:789 start_codon:yes stop_codon:yes gene_type:complete